MPRRLEQVNALLRERVAQFLLPHFELPVGTFVTVTKVETAPNLRTAKVFVTVLPESRRGSTLEGLRRLTPELQQHLYRNLTTHTAPVIQFLLDETELEAERTERLLDTL